MSRETNCSVVILGTRWSRRVLCCELVIELSKRLYRSGPRLSWVCGHYRVGLGIILSTNLVRIGFQLGHVGLSFHFGYRLGSGGVMFRLSSISDSGFI